jgi:hypothetical protein
MRIADIWYGKRLENQFFQICSALPIAMRMEKLVRS